MKDKILTSIILLTSTLSAATSELAIRHRESQGVGYNQGYSSVDYFLSAQGEKDQFFFDLRGHVFNDAKVAGNLGAGWRHSLWNDSSRVGMQIFYDFRDYSHFFVHQIGGGLEWLFQTVDVRLNGYLPVGKNENFHNKRFCGFVGNQVIVKQRFSAALPCLEGEIGTPLAKPFYFAVGSYYLFQESSHSLKTGKALGAKARFDVDLGYCCSLGALATYDHIFHTRVQGVFSITIPLGPKKKKPVSRKKPVVVERVSRNLKSVPIVRNEIIPIQTHKRTKTALASDNAVAPTFLFVNNTAPSGGLGTFESPFSSLKEAEQQSKAGDIIYVFPGDGTPHLMDEGIILKTDQILASSGSDLKINEVIIPSQTPEVNPVLTNVHQNEPVVTNPGKSKLNNFYFMNPWEYLGNYDFQSYSIDSLHAPTSPPSYWDDPTLKNWVDLGSTSGDGTSSYKTSTSEEG